MGIENVILTRTGKNLILAAYHFFVPARSPDLAGDTCSNLDTPDWIRKPKIQVRFYVPLISKTRRVENL